jgi:hypothetical protein
MEHPTLTDAEIYRLREAFEQATNASQDIAMMLECEYGLCLSRLAYAALEQIAAWSVVRSICLNKLPHYGENQ